MNPLKAVAIWLDIRPQEYRSVTLSVLGAFLVVAFMTLARALREAVYLTTFDVKTLPYITAAVVVLSLPVVGAFTKLLGRYGPNVVLKVVILILIAGLGAIWPFATRDPGAVFSTTVVVFYLWTALGTLVVTSGFWVVTSETFPVRGAKRLFGLIGAGGTAGAMVMGLSLSWITGHVRLIWLLPILIGLLALLYGVELLFPKGVQRAKRPQDDDSAGSVSLGQTLTLIRGSPHLRTIALVVFISATASTLVDYQFKEFARLRIADDAELTGFFGAFYGWTGGIALAIQLVGAARIVAVAGIGTGLSILALFLMLGSTAFVIVPGVALITIVRGGDNSLRKALHRPFIEFLYVPIPATLRRKTKTFIDSVVDSAAEGFGALLIFLWVTLPGLPSRYLSVFVIFLAFVFILLNRGMGREYFGTIVRRLKEENADAEELMEDAGHGGGDLLTASFTRMDLQSIVVDAGVIAAVAEAVQEPEGEFGARAAAPQEGAPSGETGFLDMLRSPDAQVILKALDQVQDLAEVDDEHVSALTRLLARDAVHRQAAAALIGLGDRAVPALTESVRDEGTDFVIRRRIPRVLADIGCTGAVDALLGVLSAGRFEVRYRAVIALVHCRKGGFKSSGHDWKQAVWNAIRTEVGRTRPVWELQKLLDDSESADDGLVVKHVGVRGELSLEHTFRMLTLVLDPEPVRAAFHGILLDDERLKSFALEYLEQALPVDIRKRLWLFIGDVSEYKKAREMRSLDKVVDDLMVSRATLFAGEKERDALKRMLEGSDE